MAFDRNAGGRVRPSSASVATSRTGQPPNGSRRARTCESTRSSSRFGAVEPRSSCRPSTAPATSGATESNAFLLSVRQARFTLFSCGSATPEVPPVPPRIVSGFSWLLDRFVIAQTLEAALMSGVKPEDHVPERTPAEYYAKAIKFDDSEAMLAAGLNPVDDQTFDADMSVLHADGRVMRWHMWARGGA